MNNKRGSSAVFLSVILASLISITMVFIYGVKEEALKSRLDATLSLACDSILSEFNYDVQKEYGLFILKGNNNALERKISKYVRYTTDGMDGVKLENMKVSGSRFSVMDTKLIEEQIIEYVKFAEINGIIKGHNKDKENNGNILRERNLKHGPTAVSLPSSDIPRRNLTQLAESLAEKATSLDNAFKEGSEDYMINTYILNGFNNMENAVSQEHFFKCEAEYILGGELSDRKNNKRVEMALKAMRFILNLSHIKADTEKQALVSAAAELITPGPAAIATKTVIETTWAYAEADNDVELLQQGYKVPLKKDNTTWAVDLDGAIEGLKGNTIIPDAQKGYGYGGYLQVLLFFQDRETKVARILDLIQINMRYSKDKDFLISEYCVGIEFTARINGREYGYEKRY